MLILERSTGQWQILGNAADDAEADSMTQDRRGDFLLIDTEQLTVSGFRRVLKREPISPAATTAPAR